MNKQRLSLDRPATYQLKIQGIIGETWEDYAVGIVRSFEGENGPMPVTVLTGTLDQAALQGLLRRLYSLGIPLLSVTYIDCE